MDTRKMERAAANDERKFYDLEKIESIAVRSVEDYIDSFPKMKSYIFTNDKTPIWDGEIYVHNNNINEKRKNENFFAKIPLQVKGTTNTTNQSYWIGREHLIGYKKERGTLFFLVQEDENLKPIKILYNFLSSDALDTLLEQDTKTIKIDLKEMPENPDDFEKEIFEFTRERNGEKIENPATEEIESLVKKFEEIEKHLDEIEDVGVRLDLKPLLKTIKELKEDGNLQDERTVGWRDKFIYYSQKAIELVVNNINQEENDFIIDLQFEFGTYLHKQKLYHLVEDYYLNVLIAFQGLAKDNPAAYMGYVANTLNNLASLHYKLNLPDEAEEEFNEALDILRELAKDTPAAYMGNVAMTLHNLANLHAYLNRPVEAEMEYKEALKIRWGLAKDKPATYLSDVANTLHNLANLHAKHNQSVEAEREYKYSLEFSRGLAKINPVTYMGDVAKTLNNLAALHINLNRPVEAEKEFQEALEIKRGLAKDNPAAYLGDVATTLNNLAILHQNLNSPYKAEEEFNEALEIYYKLIKDNPTAYMSHMAGILNNLAYLHDELNYTEDAELEYMVALEFYRRIAKVNPAAYKGCVANTLTKLSFLKVKNGNRIVEAIQACEEAIGIYKALTNDSLHRWNDKMDKTQQFLDHLLDIINQQ